MLPKYKNKNSWVLSVSNKTNTKHCRWYKDLKPLYSLDDIEELNSNINDEKFKIQVEEKITKLIKKEGI